MQGFKVPLLIPPDRGHGLKFGNFSRVNIFIRLLFWMVCPRVIDLFTAEAQR
jgi:hypothetical protein